MKTDKSNFAGYESPAVTTIEISAEGVLCQSGGNSSTQDFGDEIDYSGIF